uniref:BTB domain-containing protein n=1 Tax=Plectus sambesii TaxID=2011161 RepID=A0A914WMN3_9BILA
MQYDEVTLKLIEKSEHLECMVCGCLSATNSAFEDEDYNSERHIKNQKFINNQTLSLEKFDYPADELLVALIINHEAEECTTRQEILSQQPPERMDTPIGILGNPISQLDTDSTANLAHWMFVNQSLPSAFNFERTEHDSVGNTQDIVAEDRSESEFFENDLSMLRQSTEAMSNASYVDNSCLDGIAKQHNDFLSSLQYDGVKNPVDSTDYLVKRTMDSSGEGQESQPTCHMVGNELYVTYKITMPPSGQEQNMLTESNTSSPLDPCPLPKLFSSEALLANGSDELPYYDSNEVNVGENETPNIDMDSTEAQANSFTSDEQLFDFPTATASSEQINVTTNNSIDEGFDVEVFSSSFAAFYGNAPAPQSSNYIMDDNNQSNEEDSQATTSQSEFIMTPIVTYKAHVEMENMGYDGVDWQTMAVNDGIVSFEQKGAEKLVSTLENDFGNVAADDDGESPPQLERQAPTPTETCLTVPNVEESATLLESNEMPTAYPTKTRLRVKELLKNYRKLTNRAANHWCVSATRRKRKYAMRPTRRGIAIDYSRRTARKVPTAPQLIEIADDDVVFVDKHRGKDKNHDPDYEPDEDKDEDGDEDEEDPDYQVDRGAVRRRKRPKYITIHPSQIVDQQPPPEQRTADEINLKIQTEKINTPPPNLFLQQYEKQEFCDYELLCQGKVLKVHRFVLTQVSKIFKKMRHDRGKKKFRINRAKVNCCSFEVLCALVRYCYTFFYPPEKYATGMFQEMFVHLAVESTFTSGKQIIITEGDSLIPTVFQ